MRRSSGGSLTGRMPALLTAGVVLFTAACSGSGSEPSGTEEPVAATSPARAAGTLPSLGERWTAQDVQAMYEKDRGLRLPLPVILPEGYVFVGFLPADVRETKNGKSQVVGRKAWFSLGHETVTVCAELLRARRDLCAETNIDVSHTRNGILHTVSAEIPVLNDTEVWGTVEYSENPADWTWL